MIFADSENQGRKRYFMKIWYLGECKEYGPWSDVALYIVGNISLRKFDIFQFRLKKSSIMILDFNFKSASSEDSDEPVHLHSLARVVDVRIH